MKAARWLGLLLSVPLVIAGCRGGATKDSADKEYDVKGKVVDVAADKKAVTLDHEAIPGLMGAMKMKFAVEEPEVLEGINPGDQVQGRLKVKSRDYVITRLEKR